MYGVVYELWRLAKANKRLEGNAYRSALDKANASATVDIISGASAGGLNGILLGKALANGSHLGVAKQMWLEDADFSTLLKDPNEKDPRSFLRSEYFLAKIQDGLGAMDDLKSDPLVKTLDVFAATTRLRSWIKNYIDGFGEKVDTADFRKSIHLKFRTKGFNPANVNLGYHRNDFDEQQNEFLAKIAVASSAFPGAFEPQLLKQADAKKHFAPKEPDSFFSDGGILDNKPFTEALSTIFTRTTDRPFERWLLSVEPDPEEFHREQRPGPQPEILEVITKAASSIPRYESIAGDLDRLREHQDKVRLRESLVEQMRSGVQILLGSGDVNSALASQASFHVYEPLRRTTSRSDLIHRIAEARGIGEGDLVSLENGVRLAESRGFDLIETDIGFELRKIYHLIKEIDRPKTGLTPQTRVAIKRRLWARFERFDSIRWNVFYGTGSAAASALASIDPKSPTVVDAVANFLSLLKEELQPQLNVERAVTSDLMEAYLMTSESEAEAALLTELFLVARHFEVWDMFLLPFERLSGIEERSIVTFGRITPSAAKFVEVDAAHKLAGDSVGHFGGFLSKEWRANDILWGRLDSAEMIMRVLLKGKPIEVQKPLIRKAQEEIAEEELTHYIDGPEFDYKHFLEHGYDVGRQGLADLPDTYRVSLLLRLAQVGRNVLKKLETAQDEHSKPYPRPLAKAFRWAGSLLGLVLSILRHPVEAVWGHDRLRRRALVLIFTFLAGWGVLLFALMSIGIVEWSLRAAEIAGLMFLPFLLWAILSKRRVSRGTRRVGRLLMLSSGVVLILLGFFLVSTGVNQICLPMMPPVCSPSSLTALGKAGVVSIALGFAGVLVSLVRMFRGRRQTYP